MNVFFPGRVRHLGALACLAWAMPSLAADALSEITVTAARQAQPRQAALADVTIIDRAELDRAGQDALPLILVDGEVALAGRYPKRAELALWIGIDQPTDAAKPATGCCSSRGCC